MSLLDLVIVFAYLLLVRFTPIGLSLTSLAVLVGVLCIERVLKGERL